jgi:hypothetical protein
VLAVDSANDYVATLKNSQCVEVNNPTDTRQETAGRRDKTTDSLILLLNYTGPGALGRPSSCLPRHPSCPLLQQVGVQLEQVVGCLEERRFRIRSLDWFGYDSWMFDAADRYHQAARLSAQR